MFRLTKHKLLKKTTSRIVRTLINTTAISLILFILNAEVAGSSLSNPPSTLEGSLTSSEPTSAPTTGPTSGPTSAPTSTQAASTLTATENSPEYVVIRASDQVTFSSETVASISDIPMKEGSKFQTGDILLEFDCRLQQAELKKALAQQASAKISQSAAKKLKSYGSISEYEYVKATSEAEIANAEVDRLMTVVDKCTIKAPFDGAIAEIMAHNHESVKPGDPLLKIVNTTNLEFEMQVPSCWLQWLHPGLALNVHINENNETISAKISKINPQVEAVTQTVKLIAIITPNNPSLLPGMSGQAIFPDNPSHQCQKNKG